MPDFKRRIVFGESVISNIVLIGMPGTYKTTAGKSLAERLGMYFLDTDDYFEFEYSMKISECFDEWGEDVFRDLESKVADRVHYFENTVIATGGGMIERDASIEKLKRFGIIILLTCDCKVLSLRLRDEKKRPLLRGVNKKAKVKKLWRDRKEKYHKYADIVIDNTRFDCGQTVEEIERELVKFYNK